MATERYTHKTPKEAVSVAPTGGIQAAVSGIVPMRSATGHRRLYQLDRALDLIEDRLESHQPPKGKPPKSDQLTPVGLVLSIELRELGVVAGPASKLRATHDAVLGLQEPELLNVVRLAKERGLNRRWNGRKARRSRSAARS